MRSLKIPIFYQPQTKPYCGPACVKMVLAYYGVKVSLRNLIKLMPMTRNGISPYSMGGFLKALAPTVFIDKNSACSCFWCKRDKRLYKEAGGVLIPRAVRISDIRLSLFKGYPVILNVTNGGSGGHYVVIRHINIKKREITYNDPAYGTLKEDIDYVMGDCHDWSGGAIIVGRKGPSFRR